MNLESHKGYFLIDDALAAPEEQEAGRPEPLPAPAPETLLARLARRVFGGRPAAEPAPVLAVSPARAAADVEI